MDRVNDSGVYSLPPLPPCSTEDHIEEEHLNEIEKLLAFPAQLCKDLVQPVEPLAVICHGDYLRNNVAFKYPDTEKVSESGGRNGG